MYSTASIAYVSAAMFEMCLRTSSHSDIGRWNWYRVCAHLIDWSIARRAPPSIPADSVQRP